MNVFNLYHIEHSTIVNNFRQYFDEKIMPGIIANFCSNNSDGRIWAFYSTYLTIDMDNPGIGPIEIRKGPLKLCNWHVLECDMDHLPILKAHHHFGPGLSLTLVLP